MHSTALALRRFTSFLLPALVTATAASAQSAWRFDMGAGPTTTGYVAVGAGATYPQTWAGPQYGWYQSTGLVGGDAAIADEIVHVQPEELLRDHVDSTAGVLTFGLNVPAGTYHVTVYLGDVTAPTADMRISANGRVVADDLFARTVNSKASLEDALGGFKRVCFKCQVPAQTVPNTPRLRLKFEGTTGQGCPVMAVEVRPYAPEPLYFDHASRQLVASGSPSPDLAAGIAAFNADLYDDAVAWFRLAGTNDPAEKLAMCYGFAFVLGSLTPHMAAVDTALLAELLAELQAMSADDSRVHNLLVEAADFQLGELFDRTRGYTKAAFDNEHNLVSIAPSGTVPTWITLNLCAAVQLLEQMQDDILAGVASPYATESPLYPKARYLIARNMWGRNTLVTPGESVGATCDLAFVSFNKYWLGIIEGELWPNLSGPSPLYPLAHEAIAFCFLLERYVDMAALDAPANEKCQKLLTAGLFGAWAADPELPVPGIPVAQTWWAPYSVIPDSTAAGGDPWAQDLRAHTRQFRNLAQWWIQQRLLPNDVTGIPEFGGGSGDDQELALLSTPWIGRAESGDNPNVEQPLNAVWDAYLYREPQVSVEEGYFADAGDVEHSAEFTTNLLFVLMPTDYGNPDYFALGARTMRNLEDPHQAASGSPSAWTLGFPAGAPTRRHFRSYVIGGVEPPDLASPFNHDMPINMKAVVPGLHVLAYNGSTELQRLFDEHAWAWRDAAMSTTGGKPTGFFPGSVEMGPAGPTGMFGDGSGWWSTGQYSDFPGFYGTDIYLNQVTASRHQAFAADREALLDPLAAAVLYVASYAGGDPEAMPGTPEWVAGKARVMVANAAWLGKSDLLAYHPSFHNPNDPNDPVVLANIASLNAVIDQYASPTPRFLNQATAGATDKAAIADTFGVARKWLQHYWPMATTAVNHVDRLILGIKAHNALQSAPSAGIYGLAPTYAVSWFNPDSDASTTPAEELDCAILVNRIDSQSLEVLLYNAASQPQSVGMRAWRVLELGEYSVQIGPDFNGDDRWDQQPTALDDFDFAAAGEPLVFDLAPGLQLLRLTRTGPPTGSTPDLDLAVGRHGLTWKDNAAPLNDSLHVRVYNLARADFAGTATVQLTVGGNPPAIHPIPTLLGLDSPAAALTPGSYDLPAYDLGSADPDPDTVVTVEIVFPDPQPSQITTANDKVTFRLGDLDRR